MATTIKCNKCANEIEITEAIKGELEEKVLQETKAKHQYEIDLLQKSNHQTHHDFVTTPYPDAEAQPPQIILSFLDAPTHRHFF